jgi:hypothetical protein
MAFPPSQVGASPTLDAELCQGSKYLVYCDSILSSSERLKHWYQYFNIVLALTCVSLPVLVWLWDYLRARWRLWRERKARWAEESEQLFGIDGTKHDALPVPVLYLSKNHSTFNVIHDAGGHSQVSLDYRQRRNSNGGSPTPNSRTNRPSSPFGIRSYLPDRVNSSLGFRDSKPGSPVPSLTGREYKLDRAASSLSIRELCEDERQSWLHPSADPHNSLPAINNAEAFPLAPFLRANVRASTQSINLRPEVDPEIKFNPLQNFDMSITPLFTRTGVQDSRFSSPSRAASPSFAVASKSVVGLVDLQDLSPEELHRDAMMDTVNELNMLRIEKRCAGLVLRVSGHVGPTQTSQLLYTLCQRNVGVIIMSEPDEPVLRHINFAHTIGVILENSTIFPDGQRRDFFRANNVRAAMKRCAHERVQRPAFFVGFHDLWDVRPTAAVVRRAFKLAEFYGATLTHGPKGQHVKAQSQHSISMSGFDYLKAKDTVEVC